jgi:WD repeat-containing protein 68
LATFSQDSNIIRILDVRQPGQALVELKGHSSAINCIEWSPSRRGTLASGADDCLVLVWDLINQHNAAQIPNSTNTSVPILPGPPPSQGPNSSTAATTSERGPAAAWQCDYEVSNLSWSPQGVTALGTGHPRDWLGVCGGKGFWGVAL